MELNLKEAFRYQNKLQFLLDRTQEYLMDPGHVCRVETIFLRKKVMPEEENEILVSDPDDGLGDKANELMDFYLFLLREKERLCAAVRAAKNTLPIDLDSEVALNGCRQKAAAVFRYMTELRAGETVVRGGGTGYRFNAEGNQVSYRCDVRKVTTIHFNRNTARSYLNQLNRQSDEMSLELDKAMVNTAVDYVPPFDVNCSYLDALEAFLAA